MSSAKPIASGPCRVAGADRLSAAVTGDTICGAIAAAMKAHAPHANYEVDVEVQSTSKLSARLIVNGRTLPTRHMAVSDGELGAGSIRRFAEGLAEAATSN